MATTGNNRISDDRNTGCEESRPLPPPTEEEINEVRLSIGAALQAGLLRIGDRPNAGQPVIPEDTIRAFEEAEAAGLIQR